MTKLLDAGRHGGKELNHGALGYNRIAGLGFNPETFKKNI